MLNTYRSAINSSVKVCLRIIPRCSLHSNRPPYVHPNPLVQPLPTARRFRAKHANPKFKAARAKKMFKVDLPDFHEKKQSEMTPDEIRVRMKELGIQPHRPWNERPIFIASTGTSIDPYVPPEGDGKASLASKEGAKQNLEFLGKKGKSMLAVRKIRMYEEDFDLRDFVVEAQKVYINLHEALVKFDETELHKLATERAYPLVTSGIQYKTLRWGFHGSLEPPKAVHVRYIDVLTKENIFAQITVRFHTQQTLAVYDRFGRLVHGSETILKDVLEYVVFEKHVSNEYGLWRIHDKIIPAWMNLRPTSLCTFKLPVQEPDVVKEKEAPNDDKATAVVPS